jgi:hypothetical protein
MNTADKAQLLMCLGKEAAFDLIVPHICLFVLISVPKGHPLSG